MDLLSLGIGFACGLVAAAAGWTLPKVGAWLEAKVESLYADATHKNAIAAAITAAPAAAAAAVAAAVKPAS
jgi:hypothetical protein